MFELSCNEPFLITFVLQNYFFLCSHPAAFLLRCFLELWSLKPFLCSSQQKAVITDASVGGVFVLQRKVGSRRCLSPLLSFPSVREECQPNESWRWILQGRLRPRRALGASPAQLSAWTPEWWPAESQFSLLIRWRGCSSAQSPVSGLTSCQCRWSSHRHWH